QNNLLNHQKSTELLEKQTKILQKEKSELETLLNEKEAMFLQHESRAKTLKEESYELKNTLNDLESLTQEYKSANEIQQKKIIEHEHVQQKRHTKYLEKEKSLLREKEAMMQTLKAKNQELEKITQLNSDLQRRVETISKTFEENKEIIETLNAKSEEAKALVEKNEALQQLTNTIQNELTDKNKLVETLEAQHAQITETLETKESEITQNDLTIATLEEKISTLQESANKRETDTKIEVENSQKYQIVEQELADIKQQLKEKDDTLQKMQEQLQKKEEDIKRYHHLEQEFTTIQKEKDDRLQSIQEQLHQKEDILLQTQEEANLKEQKLAKELQEQQAKLTSIVENKVNRNTTSNTIESKPTQNKKGWGFGSLGLLKKAKDKLIHSDSDKSTNQGTIETREEKIALYKEDILKQYGSVDTNLLHRLVTSLGPSIYGERVETIDCDKKDELLRIKESFLRGRLVLKESDESLDKTIEEVCAKMQSAKPKYRATFYYMLVKSFKKEASLF
ncbi:MAG: DUF2853 family protein, partial [Epsilonproteobacteria bacterium]|nr:DUF2853 family protein [Campylobacterota bacterium]